VQLGSGFNFVVKEVQRERFGRPAVWQLVLGGVWYELEHKERIESGSKLLGALNVIRHVVPQKELVPRLVEEFASKLLSGVGEQSRDEDTLGGTQPNPQVIFDILDAQAAVLELTAAATGTRIVATDRRHETSLMFREPRASRQRALRACQRIVFPLRSVALPRSRHGFARRHMLEIRSRSIFGDPARSIGRSLLA